MQREPFNRKPPILIQPTDTKHCRNMCQSLPKNEKNQQPPELNAHMEYTINYINEHKPTTWEEITPPINLVDSSIISELSWRK